MPCRDYSDDYNGRSYNENNLMRAKLDKYARMLCGVLTTLSGVAPRTYQLVLDKDKELKQWWEQHQEDDARAELEAKRKTEKQLKKQKALDKLSAEERKLLGL